MTLEEAIIAERDWTRTATALGVKQNERLIKARQATAHVLHFLQGYIREDALEDAYSAFLKAAYEAEVEVVSRIQLAELERYRDAVLQMNLQRPLNSPVVTPASSPESSPRTAHGHEQA